MFHSRQFGKERETIEQTRAGAIDLNRTRKAFQAATTAIYAKAQRDPSAAELIERIRQVD